jgi:hypothetical protein
MTSAKLLERHVLALHLAPDRIGRFLAAGDGGAEAALGQLAGQLAGDARDDVAALVAQKAEPRGDARARIGVKLGERPGLRAGPSSGACRSARRAARRCPSSRARSAALFGVFDEPQRLHVVQPVGELDQQHADVFRHRQHQLAEVFRLLRLVRLQFEARQLGDAVDEPRDLGPNSRSMSSSVATVSSTVSCSSPVTIEAVSSFIRASSPATSTGCEKYGSPDSRSCEPCAFIE